MEAHGGKLAIAGTRTLFDGGEGESGQFFCISEVATLTDVSGN